MSGDLSRPATAQAEFALVLAAFYLAHLGIALRECWRTPDPAARVNPYASPLRAPSLSGLPPAYVVTAEHDPLRDEGFAYADRLRAARVPVDHRHFGSQIHAFFTFTGVLDDADKAVAEVGSAIRSAVEGS